MLRAMRRSGFTIIELLTVISIIGLILSMILPALSAAREAARKVQCQNNLRQIATAFIAHDSMHGHLPTGGWGWGWQGDPDRGFGGKQPGGWVFNILPYIEKDNLRPAGGADEAAKRDQIRRLAEIPIPLMHCISRRDPVAYPYTRENAFFNMDRPDRLARADYAANVGDNPPELYGSGPEKLDEGDDPEYEWSEIVLTGICFRQSMVRFADIVDGATNTYMVGEAYLEPDHYEDGRAHNDDQGMYVGFDRDTLRVTHQDYPPLLDTHGVMNQQGFGSAHPSGFAMATCDGAVQLIGYGVDQEVYHSFGNRMDFAEKPSNEEPAEDP